MKLKPEISNLNSVVRAACFSIAVFAGAQRVPAGPPQDVYFHADDLSNVMTVSNNAGAAIDRFEYADYGRALDPFTLTPLSLSSDAVLFNGRRLDAESDWYHFRTRYLDPRAGRFVLRDSIGVWADPSGRGSACAYAGGNPWSRMDPLGTISITLYADPSKHGELSDGEPGYRLNFKITVDEPHPGPRWLQPIKSTDTKQKKGAKAPEVTESYITDVKTLGNKQSTIYDNHSGLYEGTGDYCEWKEEVTATIGYGPLSDKYPDGMLETKKEFTLATQDMLEKPRHQWGYTYLYHNGANCPGECDKGTFERITIWGLKEGEKIFEGKPDEKKK